MALPSRRSGIPWGAIAFAGTAVAALGAVVLVSRSSKTPLPAPKRVALIGDSYAVGLGPELAKLLPDFKFEGHVGTRPDQWLSHAAACGQCGDWLASFKPDVVLVSLGVNDGATPNPTTYQSIVSRLQSLGARVVWLQPPAGVNTPAARAVISSLGVPVVPATATPLATDGLHPRSYSQWASEIAGALR